MIVNLQETELWLNFYLRIIRTIEVTSMSNAARSWGPEFER